MASGWAKASAADHLDEAGRWEDRAMTASLEDGHAQLCATLAVARSVAAVARAVSVLSLDVDLSAVERELGSIRRLT